jgi:hypothetical protein
LWRNGYKQERCYNAELLCEEAVTSRKDSTMQNCFVKKHSCLNILIHPLSYATLYYLPIKTKLIPFIYHKNYIWDTAYSNTMNAWNSLSALRGTDRGAAGI